MPFRDAQRGGIVLTGRVGPEPLDGELLVAIHGLGGHAGSYYMGRVMAAAARAGIGGARMNMRGADRGGDDIYHGGLAEDVATFLASPVFAAVEHIYLIGYSLGGHLALAYASGAVDPRVRAVTSICAPLDFDAGAREIDKQSSTMYRGHLLRGLKQTFRAAAARAPYHAPVEEVEAIRFVRDWDEIVVAPRFGFASAADYYTKVSVGPRLAHIETPTLMVVAEGDPMVKLETLLPSLERPGNVRVARTRVGGHVGFPERVDLGLGMGDGNVDDQAIAWMRAQALDAERA